MRTELARVQTEAQKQSFVRNGFDQYTFIVNGGCCDICEGLKGKHFPVAKMMPGENAPPMHPHCRCSTAAHSDRKEYEEWLDFLEKGGTTEEYNKQKAAKVNNSLTNKAEKSGIIKLPDIQIGRSIGAKSLNYDVFDLETGEMFKFVEGTRLQDVEVFAGKGVRKVYERAYKYADRYGGEPEEWQHVKAKGWLSTSEGDKYAEVHWSQCEGKGKYDFFVKRWLE